MALSAGCQGPRITGVALQGDGNLPSLVVEGNSAVPQRGNELVHDLPHDPNAPTPTPTRRISRFAQGLWRGEDPRISLVQGWYYQLGYIGHDLVLYKHRSLLDRGAPKMLPSGQAGSFPYFLPIFVARLGGQQVGAWFAIDQGVWRCDGADPYDNVDAWRRVGSLPLTAWSFDFELFENPQAGPYQGRWYLMWAGAATPTMTPDVENIYIAEVLSLDPPRLSTLDSTLANRIIAYAPGGWAATVVEAPGVVVHGEQVTAIYTGYGASSTRYALGLAMLRAGQDPLSPASWVDLNQGGCDGEVKYEPEMRSQGTAYGPGVGRVVPSPDMSESWLAYRTKVFDTGESYDLHNLEWMRAFNLKKIGWRSVSCGGQAYTIPALGPPNSLGDLQPVPAGDPGLLAAAHTMEAENLIPFGEAMGPSIQGLPRINDDPDVITVVDPAFSHASKVSHLDALAADVAGSPRRAGLTWPNAPGGSRLVVSAACAQPTTLLLLIDGALRQRLALPASATPQETSFDIGIAAGAQLQVVYEVGTSAPVDLDYLTLSGEPPA